MLLRCFTCGRNVEDKSMRSAGRTDLGDEVYLCERCVPPHPRGEHRLGAAPSVR